jgi:hypothetical protein
MPQSVVSVNSAISGQYMSPAKMETIETAASWLQETEAETNGTNVDTCQPQPVPHDGLQLSEVETPKPRHICFSDEADTTILGGNSAGAAVKKGGYSFDVSLACVQGAMPVWKKLARDPDAEHGPDGKLKLMLHEEDDPEAFICLLYIAHWSFDKIPLKPSVKLLYNMAMLAHKYGGERLLSLPVRCEWVKALKITAKHAADQMAVEIAWIGHLFKEQEIEAAMFQSLVLSVRPGDGYLGTLDTKDKMLKLRLAVIGSVQQRLRSRLDLLCQRILSKDEAGEQFCHSTNRKEVACCEAAMFGSAIAALTDMGLYPVTAFEGTVLELMEKLGDLKLVRFPEGDTPPHACHHISCGLGLELSVSDIFDSTVE